MSEVKTIEAGPERKPIHMTGVCSIEAAAAPKDGEDAALPAVKLDAYNGGKIAVGWWGDIVVDLKGMKASDVTPILYGHSTGNIESIIGQTSKVEIGDTLKADGTVMNTGRTAKQMIDLARNGYRFQVSMGADPIRYREVAEDETVEVNSQSIQGPFSLILESVLNEISILPLGADKSTSAAIAAEHKPTNPKETPMSDPKVDTAEAIRANAVSEQNRILEVRKSAESHPEIAAKAVADGWTKAQTEAAVAQAVIAEQKKEIEALKVQAERPAAPSIKVGKEGKLDAEAIECATAIRAGLKAPEKVYSEETIDAAKGARIHSMTDLVRASLAAEGKSLDATRHDTREFIRAAFSTRSIANVLSNVANKFILEGYGAVEQAWSSVASVRSVVDFKANTGVRLVMSNLLQALSPNGEIKHGALSDETRTIQADTKALMLAITRKDIINDDLGVLSDVPRKLGFAAARTFNTDFWAALVAANAANFPSNNSNGNYINTALGLAGLRSAVQAFMSLKDSDGNPIGVDASMVLTGPAASVVARELFISTNLIGGTSKDTAANPFAGRYTPVSTSYLTGNAWYLVANPMGLPLMEVAFLNGRQEPVVESADADFNTLGVQMRCVYDYGVAFAEKKAAVYSAGG